MRTPRLLAALALAAALVAGGGPVAHARTADPATGTPGTPSSGAVAGHLPAPTAIPPVPAASAASVAAARPTAVRPLPADAAKFVLPQFGPVPHVGHRGSDGVIYPANNDPSWGGYAVPGAIGKMTSASTNWVEPRIDPSVAGYAATWVGLDGYGSTTVEQIGTTAESINGQAYYVAWYEMYDANNPFGTPSVNFPDPVQPGDNLSASVNYANGYYTLYIKDITEGWSETKVIASQGQQNSSAEFIVEAPTAPGHGIQALTQFGFVDFFGNTVNGQALNSTTMNTWVLTLQDQTNHATAVPTALLNTRGDFAISYGANGAIGRHPLMAYGTAVSQGTGVYISTYSSGLTAINTYLGQTALSDPVIVSLPNGGFEAAFDADTPAGPRLMVVGTALTFNTQLGMAPNTRPAIAAASDGTFEVAFQAPNGSLYRFTPQSGGVGSNFTLTEGTSPAITALAGGGYEVAFQNYDNDLWQTGDYTTGDTHLAMAPGTNPAIAGLSGGGYEMALQDDAGFFCATSQAISGCANSLAMAPGTSPAITALAGGGWEGAFQGQDTNLWDVGTYYTFDAALGMASGTSPAIAQAADNTIFKVAFQADTGDLFTQDLAHGGWDVGPVIVGNPGIAT